MKQIDKTLAKLPEFALAKLMRGIEKESLRVETDGALSPLPHPQGLGSALTHPTITTDFSESQIEMVTGVHDSVDGALTQLSQIHQQLFRHVGEEILWATSMPCRLPADDEIPLGRFGSSNVGRSKTVYRAGLSHRYGRRMQTISGVHYNFSMPDSFWPQYQLSSGGQGSIRKFKDKSYFALIRNFRRHAWLLLYLFGASPAVCGSFVAGRSHKLKPLGSGSMYLPWGTSMRMGPLGYQSDAQSELDVSYNALGDYAGALYNALTTPYPPYVDIGILEADGYRQLNTTLLQIENEFYSMIRPKRPIRPGERALHALGERGVEYVEVRCLDLDPFSEIGVSASTASMIDIFLVYCLLSDSPLETKTSMARDASNQLAVAERGRQPGLNIIAQDGSEISLVDSARDILAQCQSIAERLDQDNGGSGYRDALAHANAVIDDPEKTPSARVLSEMKKDWGNSYHQFALDKSTAHRDLIMRNPPDENSVAAFDKSARESFQQQAEIEAGDTIDFETYRQQYLSQDLMCCGPSDACYTE